MHLIKVIVLPLVLLLFGCKSTSWFDSANNVFKKEAVVNMLDGSQKIGLLSIALEINHANNFILLSNEGKEEKILIENVKSYLINNEVFVPKKVIVDSDGPLQLLFVKKLTPDTSKIHLYELYQNGQQRDSRESLLLYYISFPSFDRFETWGMGNKNLVPNFNLKMSSIVSSCPDLAKKIREEQNGYYFTQLTISNITKRNVLQRIIAEYNLCTAEK